MTATTTAPDTRFLDAVNPESNCPGFLLWDVVASDGQTYRMAGDYSGAVETRLFFRTVGKGLPELTVKTMTLVGDNPDVKAWELARQ